MTVARAALALLLLGAAVVALAEAEEPVRVVPWPEDDAVLLEMDAATPCGGALCPSSLPGGGVCCPDGKHCCTERCVMVKKKGFAEQQPECRLLEDVPEPNRVAAGDLIAHQQEEEHNQLMEQLEAQKLLDHRLALAAKRMADLGMSPQLINKELQRVREQAAERFSALDRLLRPAWNAPAADAHAGDLAHIAKALGVPVPQEALLHLQEQQQQAEANRPQPVPVFREIVPAPDVPAPVTPISNKVEGAAAPAAPAAADPAAAPAAPTAPAAAAPAAPAVAAAPAAPAAAPAAATPAAPAAAPAGPAAPALEAGSPRYHKVTLARLGRIIRRLSRRSKHTQEEEAVAKELAEALAGNSTALRAELLANLNKTAETPSVTGSQVAAANATATLANASATANNASGALDAEAAQEQRVLEAERALDEELARKIAEGDAIALGDHTRADEPSLPIPVVANASTAPPPATADASATAAIPVVPVANNTTNATNATDAEEGGLVQLNAGFNATIHARNLQPLQWRKWRGLCLLIGVTPANVGKVGQLPKQCWPAGGRISFALSEGWLAREERTDSNSVRVDITAEGEVWQTTSNAKAEDKGIYTSWSGATWAADEGQALTLAAGWGVAGKDARAPQIAQLNSSNPRERLCVVSGKMDKGAWGPLATVPKECIPDTRILLSGDNQDPLRIDIINGTGSVETATHARNFSWASLAGVTYTPKAGLPLELDATWAPLPEYRGPSVNLVGGRLVVLSGALQPANADVKPSRIILKLPKPLWPPRGHRYVFATSHGSWVTPVEVTDRGLVRYKGKRELLGSAVDHKGPKWLSLSGITYLARNHAVELKAAADRLKHQHQQAQQPLPPPPMDDSALQNKAQELAKRAQEDADAARKAGVAAL